MLAVPVPERAPAQGLRQVLGFNWPLYALAAIIIATAALAIDRVAMVPAGRAALYLAVSLASAWIVSSLLVSWFVYDRSPLMTAAWIPDALGIEPRSWLNIHAGLDEWSDALRALLPQSPGRTLDIFDPREMTESSIVRARRSRQSRSEPANYRRLPVRRCAVDAIFLLFSAHELRAHPARSALLAEVSRVLAPGGRIIVAEHLRDWRNLLAFGPGFLHFHSRRAWMRGFQTARLGILRESSITPFVRIFLLTRLP